jgi:hypothetical protein
MNRRENKKEEARNNLRPLIIILSQVEKCPEFSLSPIPFYAAPLFRRKEKLKKESCLC